MEMEESPAPAATGTGSGTIRPIDSTTVHKICSGQVVLSLAIAVKELVENSLDAGATCVDVRFKNYGMDSIEVVDNGSGVVEENFAALTLKYHTSKLRDYSDLLGVSSFGFRGEALSSLCALSDLVITTRNASAEFATKIEYDYKGNIKRKTPCSKQVGTTVTLTNLFSSLPVRQKEFHKNAKREFARMTQLLYAYCLISTGVKITCTNQTKTSAKSVIIATQGSTSYKDNIACVFGVKQLQTLLELKPLVPSIKDNIFKGLSNESQNTNENLEIEDVDIDLSEDSNEADHSNINSSQNDASTCSQSSTKSQGHKNSMMPLEFNGFISTCTHGCGRSSSDRQFYFVNSRPCEPTKVMKIINETYKQFNPNQYPFVFLNLRLHQSGVDVNVTPDKRKIFLTKEKIILDCLKGSLLKLYEHIPGTLKINETFDKRNDTNQECSRQEAALGQPRIFASFLKNFENKLTKATNVESKDEKSHVDLKRKSTMLDFISKKTMKISPVDDGEISETVIDVTNKEESAQHIFTKKINTVQKILKSTHSLLVNEKSNNEPVDIKIEKVENFEESCSFEANTDNKELMYLESSDNLPSTQIRNVDQILDTHTIICKTNKTKDSICDSPMLSIRKSKKVITDKEDLGKYNRKSIMLKTSIEHVKALTETYNVQAKLNCPERVKFRSEINPVFNKNCEEELQREISKESFKRMEIMGQFNLGFIITKLDDDLFIVDQHATDEIYNFETLQKTTELTSQKLVIPQRLELTGVDEQVLMDNIPVFTKNGFTFEIDEEAPPTKRVKLATIPMSKNWIFGKDDIDELLFMLREAPSEYCRPSRVRAMFASRACRKSVMIGSALSKADMKILIDHMAQIDKPWNCPHGRPTIRHLVNLAMVHTE